MKRVLEPQAGRARTERPPHLAPLLKASLERTRGRPKARCRFTEVLGRTPTWPEARNDRVLHVRPIGAVGLSRHSPVRHGRCREVLRTGDTTPHPGPIEAGRPARSLRRQYSSSATSSLSVASRGTPNWRWATTLAALRSAKTSSSGTPTPHRRRATSRSASKSSATSSPGGPVG